MKSFDTLSSLYLSLTQNSTTTNQTLGQQLINDTHRYLIEKYFNNEFSSTCQGVSQQQFYPVPANYSKMKDVTITIGNLKWTPTEILTRQEWDKLNVFPYYSDIPVHYFVYNSNKIGIWPIPSTGSTSLAYTTLSGTLTAGDTVTDPAGLTATILSISATSTTAGTMIVAVPDSAFNSSALLATGSYTDSTSAATFTVTTATVTSGNTITFNYKIRVPDLTFPDYTTGTVTMTSDSATVVGSGTSWLANYITSAGSVLNLNLYLKPTAPKGDNNWYQVSKVNSATNLTLANVYPTTQSTQATVSYTIGQMPLLNEDFHDLLVYRPLTIYFSTIVPDQLKLEQFKAMYADGERRLAEYSGTKSVDVNLGRRPNLMNPNLFSQNFG